MVKRAVAALIWFIADSAFNFANLLLGMPSVRGLVVAGGVGAFVGVDGMRLFMTGIEIEATPGPAAVNPIQPPVRPTY